MSKVRHLGFIEEGNPPLLGFGPPVGVFRGSGGAQAAPAPTTVLGPRLVLWYLIHTLSWIPQWTSHTLGRTLWPWGDAPSPADQVEARLLCS